MFDCQNFCVAVGFPLGKVQKQLCFQNITETNITLSPQDGGDLVMATRPDGTKGGMAITNAIPYKEGVASFEVVILEMEDVGSEGLEIGITGSGLEDGFKLHKTYAVLSQPSWVSSDAGNLWVSGVKQYGRWALNWTDQALSEKIFGEDLILSAVFS